MSVNKKQERKMEMDPELVEGLVSLGKSEVRLDNSVRELKKVMKSKELFLSEKDKIMDAIRSGIGAHDIALWNLSEVSKNIYPKTEEQTKMANHRAVISMKCDELYLKLYNQLFTEEEEEDDEEEDDKEEDDKEEDDKEEDDKEEDDEEEDDKEEDDEEEPAV